MKWSELLSPTRRAVAELLNRLRGAVEAAALDRHDRNHDDTAGASHDHSSAKVPQQIDSTLLVKGERGTGKTTVLLCARDATERTEEFFDGAAAHVQAVADANAIRERIIWLDPLDMEPMSATANPLTTLLVRIQGALDRRRDRSDSARRVPSLIEEGSEDAAGQLDRLIRAATLIWEDATEQSTLERANQQIRAAQIYATFQRDFREAMKRVSERLSRLQGWPGGTVLVLPIDNVDRSADHVQAIFKLAQMVASPHLWLVLAGDRVDLKVFLERAYHHELALDGQHAVSARDEKQERSIARRQAAATRRKVIAPLHEIKIELVPPEDALEFSLDRDKEHSIRKLLEKIRLPPLEEDDKPLSKNDKKAPSKKKGNSESKSSKPTIGPPRTLLDLIDIGKRIRISEVAEAPDATVLSTAGKHALQMPARTLIDLWLSLWHGKDQEKAKGGDWMVVRIVRTLLRLALDETEIEDWICKRIQDKVILRGYDHDTRLLLKDVFLRASATFTPCIEIKLQKGAPMCRASMVAYRLSDVSLRVAFRRRDGGRSEPTDVPPQAAGWLILLYDILMLAKEPWILGEEDAVGGKILPLLSTRYHLLLRDVGPVVARSVWETPRFLTYFDSDIFREQWRRFIERKVIEVRDGQDGKAISSDQIAAAWIGCANSVLSPDHGGWTGPSVDGWTDPSVKVDALLDASAARFKEIANPLERWNNYADTVRSWIEGGLLVPLLPEMSGNTSFDAHARRLFHQLGGSKEARVDAGWARFERMRRALEEGLRQATRDREPPRGAGEAKLRVRLAGNDGPPDDRELDCHEAASVLAGWLLGDAGPFHVAAEEVAVEQFLPEKVPPKKLLPKKLLPKKLLPKKFLPEKS